MKFRTEIRIPPLDPPIDYCTTLLSIGSCFADVIASRLAAARFRVTANPTGVLFNPLSIARTLGDFVTGRMVRRSELHYAHGLWYHYDFHGSCSAPSPELALQGMQVARQAGTTAIARCRYVLVTFGTAWVYERADTGEVVANCHKQPQGVFRRRLLDAEEIAAAWSPLLEGPLAGKRLLLSVSPVRHLADGLEGNSLSKAVLRIAADRLARSHPAVRYFPSFEILTDDLRDYRFYGEDLVHPSVQATDYIWEQFTQAALSREARALLPRVEAIVQAARHRPLHPDGEEFRAFCREMLARIEALPEIDLEEEKTRFSRCLQINS